MHILSTQRVDAAVLDIKLHEERCFDLALRLADRSTPFVFLSGYSRDELPEPLQRHPLIQKPFDADQLIRQLDGMLGREA